MPTPRVNVTTLPRLARLSPLLATALATLGVAIATGLAFRFAPYLTHQDLALIFLAAVLFVSAGLGLWPSIYASVLSFFVYNFFFTEPYYTFHVTYNADLARLGIFLLVASITGHLAARMRAAVENAKATARRTEALYDFSRRMAAMVSLADALEATVDHLSATLGRPAVALMPGPDGKLVQRASSAADVQLAPGDLARAQQVWEGRTAVPGPWRFLRLQTSRGPVGLAAIGLPSLSPELTELAEGLCGQAAVALERTQLAGELEDTRMAAETEQLRAALLTSLSHDLQVPLNAIRQSADALLTGEAPSVETCTARMRTVRDEANRLLRYLQNLLDMTRIGDERMPLRRAAIDLRTVVEAARERLAGPLSGFDLALDLEDLPPVYVHAALLEQVLVNVLDNAARYSPSGGNITLRLRGDAAQAVIEVIDQGPGIPAAATTKEPGRGLGLTIARALVGAHAGELTLQPGPDGRGTAVRITLPLTSS
jgi:two-component system sensor histidine kinase KdpD